MPSARFHAAIAAQETAEKPVTLVTITHASFAAPLRYCTGGLDLVSLTRPFKARQMLVVLPGESASAGARAGRLTIDDVDAAVIAPLRNAATKPRAAIELVLAGFPDDIELSWPGLFVKGYRKAGLAVELDLARRDDSVEVWPYQTYAPNRTPGLY